MKNYDVKDLSLAKAGRNRIEWAGKSMQVLSYIAERFSKDKPLKALTIGACLHVTAETANLMLTLQKGGAEIFLCASNPLSTQDDVAASLVKDFGVQVFAIKGEDNSTYYRHLETVLEAKPSITMDDGADLIHHLHTKYRIALKNSRFTIENDSTSWEFLGSSEETTTGVIRLKAMEKDKALKVPVIAVNDSDTKHLFDNRYGTGQSTLDGIVRATNILLAGKHFVVCGYGWCGRGLAARARGMGALVTVTEVDPMKALEAVMDGYMVEPIAQAVKTADIIVTVTGDHNVVTYKHMLDIKDGAIIANSGHFNVEIELDTLQKKALSCRVLRPFIEEYIIKNNKRIYILGEGRLINLTAAEGHPAEVMDMSFANQSLAADFFVKNKGKLSAKIYTIPAQLDHEIASLKLNTLGVKIDSLTPEQKKYLDSWQVGT